MSDIVDLGLETFPENAMPSPALASSLSTGEPMEAKMKLTQRIALSVMVLGIGLGSGHLLQTRAAKSQAARETALNSAPEDKPVAITTLASGPNKAIALTPQPRTTIPGIATPALPPLTTDAMQEPKAIPLPQTSTTADNCDVSLDLITQPSAMLGLTMIAPCQPNARVVLRHAGLAVTAQTSATGSLFLSLPAMEQSAKVSVLFADGAKVTAQIEVPDMADYRRFAVQWLANDTFQLHAFEGDADYGMPGHISAATPGRIIAGVPPKGGFLNALGNNQVDLPMLAEIYTFPANLDDKVRVIVEAAVTSETCGRELLGETLASTAGHVTVTDLTLAMPDCSAEGSILVLKNLAPDTMMTATAD